MNTVETKYTVDRSKWSRGPWDKESEDKIQFRTEVGYPGLLVRSSLGAWCGYVGVPRGHQDYERDYENVDVGVHGGLTFADTCQPNGSICHVPEPGEPDDVWWLGFDTAHFGDSVPSRTYTCRDGEYRDMAYVRAEVESLAKQLKAREELKD